MSSPLRIDHRITIPGEELEERFVRSGGPGGQNVNKLATAVQLRFRASESVALNERVRARLLRLAGQRATRDGDIVIESTKTRSQARNRDDARDRLRELVREAAEPLPPVRRKTRATRGSIERRLKAKAARGALKKDRSRPQAE